MVRVKVRVRVWVVRQATEVVESWNLFCGACRGVALSALPMHLVISCLSASSCPHSHALRSSAPEKLPR